MHCRVWMWVYKLDNHTPTAINLFFLQQPHVLLKQKLHSKNDSTDKNESPHFSVLYASCIKFGINVTSHSSVATTHVGTTNPSLPVWQALGQLNKVLPLAG